MGWKVSGTPTLQDGDPFQPSTYLANFDDNRVPTGHSSTNHADNIVNRVIPRDNRAETAKGNVVHTRGFVDRQRARGAVL